MGPPCDPEKVWNLCEPAMTVSRFLAGLWPWPLVAFFVWLLGQFVVGYFYNEFLMESGFLVPGLILGLMVLAIVSGFARDAQE
jgi:hypothetical protein